ncbi:sodium/potassium-transporting ATPase subunit gamma-like [Anabas testudineus]|uniref:sodium/potassium-transporting ATPase subunit gamma-like n=1 Tax=Anabas testudineus TaxID=64144 RepID=UPI000E45EB57|nr:sodium/potassium-transporting ATPase subunit gamma-like [Anabas testudineus]
MQTGPTHTYILLDRGNTEPSAAQFCQPHTHTNRRGNMSSPTGAETDYDADFVYDYYTLRVGGLAFAGVIVFLSIILLAGNKIRNCGKSKPRHVEEE